MCGATQGIGRAAALEFARAGARVVLVGRNEDGLAKVLDELKAVSVAAHETVKADFSDLAGTERIAHETARRLGAVHILVNNTGGPAAGMAIEAKPQDYLAAMSMHLGCAQAWTQACAPLMREAVYGRIINITSTSVFTPIKGLGVSNTVRAAMANWTKTLASELGRFGITVNNVMPGFTKTARLEALFKGKAARGGMTVDEVEILKARGYDAMEFYNRSPELAKVIDQLKDGTFSKNGDPGEFVDIVNNLLYHDRFLTLADFDAYIEAQNRVSETYRVMIFSILFVVPACH